ncbi:hypothetical protein HPB48_002854 [Haemaphysalis longicornis]|uniref:Uncharacterized protein n=1 Tax=Haemaphysalis longicornis TaxID=44386 RepID=A0A9J6FWC1_HAELO|nr:hypothetical protein HPB48_002854 [Haemaphysalis longicornis]
MPSHYHRCPYYVTRFGNFDHQVGMKNMTAHAKRFSNAVGRPEAEKHCAVYKIQGAVFARGSISIPRLGIADQVAKGRLHLEDRVLLKNSTRCSLLQG